MESYFNIAQNVAQALQNQGRILNASWLQEIQQLQ